MSLIQNVPPAEIESRSFSIIEEEFYMQTSLKPSDFEEGQFQVIQRVIHATGDFSFARSLQFHDKAIDAALSSLRQGKDIYIDVKMGASGINRSLLNRFGGEVLCYIGDKDVAEKAKAEGKTRSETALEKLRGANLGMIVVGNAPTALLAAMKSIEAGALNPDIVIGVPVGFVNALESKSILARQTYPHITNEGRKGGSPVAVAIVNALLKLAVRRDAL